MPAIDPAISTRPVMNQLIPNVSSVPKVRQLTALRTDRACVSAPRNKTTGQASLGIIDATAYHGGFRLVRHARNAKIAPPPMDRLHEYVHFAQRNQTNALIELNNTDRSGTPSRPAGSIAKKD